MAIIDLRVDIADRPARGEAVGDMAGIGGRDGIAARNALDQAAAIVDVARPAAIAGALELAVPGGRG